MSNQILTIDQITKASLAVLRSKLNFVNNINNQYDSSFAQSGAKIGDALRVRKPAQFVVRNGSTMVTKDYKENSVNLKIDSQTGVDVEFTGAELTLSLDEFTARVIEPAMARLAAEIESRVISKSIAGAGNVLKKGAGTIALKDFLKANAKLNKNAISPSGRYAWLSPDAQVEVLDELKGLFNSQSEISKQYTEGKMGRAAGLDWFENTFLPSLVIPAIATAVTDGALTANFSKVVVKAAGNATVIKAGTPFTIAGIYAVHPETGDTLGDLYSFVVAEDATASAAGAITLKLTQPAIGPGALGVKVPGQNISAWPADEAVVATFTNGTYQTNLVAQRDSIAFASADLPLPEGTNASREVLDGLSIRVVRGYDIKEDKHPCRFDILWGSGVLEPNGIVNILS